MGLAHDFVSVSLAAFRRDSLRLSSVPAESNAVLGDVAVMGVAEKVARMPPELQAEGKDFVDFPWQKKVRKAARKKKPGNR